MDIVDSKNAESALHDVGGSETEEVADGVETNKTGRSCSMWASCWSGRSRNGASRWAWSIPAAGCAKSLGCALAYLDTADAQCASTHDRR